MRGPCGPRTASRGPVHPSDSQDAPPIQARRSVLGEKPSRLRHRPAAEEDVSIRVNTASASLALDLETRDEVEAGALYVEQSLTVGEIEHAQGMCSFFCSSEGRHLPTKARANRKYTLSNLAPLQLRGSATLAKCHELDPIESGGSTCSTSRAPSNNLHDDSSSTSRKGSKLCMASPQPPVPAASSPADELAAGPESPHGDSQATANWLTSGEAAQRDWRMRRSVDAITFAESRPKVIEATWLNEDRLGAALEELLQQDRIVAIVGDEPIDEDTEVLDGHRLDAVLDGLLPPRGVTRLQPCRTDALPQVGHAVPTFAFTLRADPLRPHDATVCSDISADMPNADISLPPFMPSRPVSRCGSPPVVISSSLGRTPQLSRCSSPVTDLAGVPHSSSASRPGTPSKGFTMLTSNNISRLTFFDSFKDFDVLSDDILSAASPKRGGSKDSTDILSTATPQRGGSKDSTKLREYVIPEIDDEGAGETGTCDAHSAAIAHLDAAIAHMVAKPASSAEITGSDFSNLSNDHENLNIRSWSARLDRLAHCNEDPPKSPASHPADPKVQLEKPVTTLMRLAQKRHNLALNLLTAFDEPVSDGVDAALPGGLLASVAEEHQRQERSASKERQASKKGSINMFATMPMVKVPLALTLSSGKSKSAADLNVGHFEQDQIKETPSKPTVLDWDSRASHFTAWEEATEVDVTDSPTAAPSMADSSPLRVDDFQVAARS